MAAAQSDETSRGADRAIPSRINNLSRERKSSSSSTAAVMQINRWPLNRPATNEGQQVIVASILASRVTIRFNWPVIYARRRESIDFFSTSRLFGGGGGGRS